MTFVWQALCAALLPVDLADIPRVLDRFLDHLERWSPGPRMRRADTFYRNLQADFA